MADRSSIQEQLDLEFKLQGYNALHRWLTYEGYSPLLLGGGFFLPWGLVFGAAILAAIIFTPVLVYSLVRLQKLGWLSAFFILVVPGLLLGFYLAPERQLLLTLVLTTLPPFYIYCWALRTAVDSWRESIRAHLGMIYDSDWHALD